MNENRSPWFLLTGLIIGVLLGVLYNSFIRPADQPGIDPGQLTSADRDRYRVLIALAYMANTDLVRASARLELLKDEDVNQALIAQAQKILDQGGTIEEANALARLADDLSNNGESNFSRFIHAN